jgi:hypothetical protein
MVKQYAFIRRRPDLTHAQFDEYWHHPHGDPISLRLKTLEHYIHTTPIQRGAGLDVPLTDWDGIVELWYESWDAADRLHEDPEMPAAVADQPNYSIQDATRVVSVDEDPVSGGAGPGDRAERHLPGVKLVHLVRRAHGLSPEEFRAAWAGADDRRLGAVLGATRHVRCAANPRSYADGEAPEFDAVRELWFDDARAVRRARAEQPEAWSGLFERAEVGADRSCFAVATQRRLR